MMSNPKPPAAALGDGPGLPPLPPNLSPSVVVPLYALHLTFALVAALHEAASEGSPTSALDPP